MVLIAAAICTKSGKVLLSRQFVEMTKARIEGLLAAFPKLMMPGKQHTFVESDSVRYVYQPLDKLFMLLITTKSSNILEDLETLRLFSRVVPVYCRTMDEAEVTENGFNLIFAFDEIVALGYRENVNLSQIKTFVEMDSHEEKVFQAVRQTQEREAKSKMREMAKALHRQKLEANKKGGKVGYNSASFGSSFSMSSSLAEPSASLETKTTSFNSTTSKSVAAPAKSLKLGSKARNVDSFVDQLKSEGETVSSNTSANDVVAKKNAFSLNTNVKMEKIHFKSEEKLRAIIGKDGGIQSFELEGKQMLRIASESYAKISIQMKKNEDKRIQMKINPNVDKEAFWSLSQINPRNPSKPFPVNSEVDVLKWRYQSLDRSDESVLPITINCWPSNNGQGGCDVNIEYQLEHDHLQLNNVEIVIPLPMGCAATILECDGDYKQEKSKLIWSIPLVNKENSGGMLEFSAQSSAPTDFFPLAVSFASQNLLSNVSIQGVTLIDEGTELPFSQESILMTEKYEIV